MGAGSTSAPTVFFLSDSTGITAETLGNTLLTQFPAQHLERRTVPFITTVEQAQEVVAVIDQVAAAGPRPLVFSTTVSLDVRAVLARSRGHFFDLIGTHLGQLEQALHASASGQPGQAHGVGDAVRYQSRMAAVEYAIEHDDGQSLRALERAELILIAPSRCGKTPTTMYLALQHGILAANFPLVEEDFESLSLPKPLLPFAREVLRADVPAGPAEPDPPGAPPRQQLRLAEPVLLRAAQRRGHVPGEFDSVRELRLDVRGGNFRHRPATDGTAPLSTRSSIFALL